MMRPFLTSLVAALTLCACAVGPDFIRPAPPVDQPYNQGGDPVSIEGAGGENQRFFHGTGESSWWKQFHSDELDAAVTDAMAHNPGLQAAQASLRQSEANLKAGYGIFYPQVNAALSTSRQRFNPAAFGSSAQPSIFNLNTLSASVSYVLDVFGGQRRLVEGLEAQVGAQRAQVAATYLILTGNIVNTVLAISAYQAQIEETGRMLDAVRQQRALTEKQYQSGLVAYGSVTTLESQLASLEASLPPLKQHLTQAEHLLATLEGRAPGSVISPRVAFDQLALPRDLPVALPSELARSRPDILAAEAQLHAASAGIGVATAALFPSFTLTGTVGQESSVASQLFESTNRVWGIGADVAAPLFNGGTLIARREGAREAYRQGLALYEQTVLVALAQVADGLRALANDADTLAANQRDLEASSQSFQLAQTNYAAGLAGYPAVLSAEVQQRVARIAWLQARAQQLQDTTALYVALGGAWWDKD